MIKYFCDPCGREVDHTANRSSWSVDRATEGWPKVPVTVEVMVTIDKTTNGGHICADCAARVISEGEYRRKTTR